VRYPASCVYVTRFFLRIAYVTLCSSCSSDRTDTL